MQHVPTELEQELGCLEPGSHLCLLYSDHDEQMAAAVPFMRDGLASHERCIYVADDRSVDEVLACFRDRGLDPRGAIESGALSLHTKRDTYLKSGRFDPDRMLALIGEETEKALANGHAGLRVTGEMTWALDSNVGEERLIEYEARLNDFLPGKPARAICQYNVSRFPLETIAEVLHTHPIAVIGSEVCPNIYYEPPSHVLGKASHSERVRWMIEQLLGARRLARERVRVESRAHDAERLEALARMASAVAHDFNDVLTVMVTASNVLHAELASRGLQIDAADELVDGTRRATRLTHELMAFGHQHASEPEIVDLNELVRRMERMIRRTVGERVDVVSRPQAGLWLTSVDPTQLQQAIMSLVTNAHDAMPNGGRLTLETRNVHADAGELVQLSVSDNGAGMNAETRARVFEPFFTTKVPGTGAGLGLATAYGIVKQARGSISVRSTPGAGSTFEILLPRARAPAAD